jgi:hypothetical protein
VGQEEAKVRKATFRKVGNVETSWGAAADDVSDLQQQSGRFSVKTWTLLAKPHIVHS